MAVWYNDNEPFIGQWLGELVKAGELPEGDLEDRSIAEIMPHDLSSYTQCHFFAGIGGWPYALHLAGWGKRPVWTASCPCQPFSAAGKRQGTADKRHLWPELRRLIAECRPPTIFGEQVASKDGRLWLAGVRADLEALGYAFGTADLCAAGVGAPNIRQRLFWVADANGGLAGDRRLQPGRQYGQQPQDGSTGERLADAERDTGDARRPADQPAESFGAPPAGPCIEPGRCSVPSGVGNAARERRHASRDNEGTTIGRERPFRNPGAWDSAVYIPCADGKARRIEPSIQPLAHGIPNRVGTLRGAGNAINPILAAEFISAYLDLDAA